MAKEVLTHNDIAYADFAQAVRAPLEGGRGKYRNVFHDCQLRKDIFT